MLTVAAVVLAVIALCVALRLAAELIVPIIFALLLNAVFRPVTRFLERHHVPPAAGGAVIVIGLLLALVGIGFSLSGPVQNWMHKASESFAAAESKVNLVRQHLKQVTDVAKRIE